MNPGAPTPINSNSEKIVVLPTRQPEPGQAPAPGPRRFSNRGLRRLARGLRKHAFGLRLTLALVLSMVLLVGAGQIFFTGAITQQLLDQGARSYAAEGVALEQAYREGDSPADSLDDVLDLEDSIINRPDVISANLLDAKMQQVDAPRDSGLHDFRGAGLALEPHISAALKKGRSFAGIAAETTRHASHFEFVVPVRLGGANYVLAIDHDASALHTQVTALRNETILFSTAALIAALILFYFLGGRALSRRHGRALKGATRDSLTDLGNHSTFQEELARAVAFASRREEPMALALIDLDDFKFVNDRFGHRRGDEVLIEIAQVLESGRAEDRAFRIGGDEFALLMPGSNGKRALTAVKRLLAKATRGSDAASFTSGIAVLPPEVHDNPTALWEQADAALYEGKRTGGSHVVVFDDVAGQLSIVTPEKVHSLRTLLAEPHLETAFQPIWKLQDNAVLGFEALARPEPEYGFDGPAEAFAIAEKIGRAHELDAICRAAALARANELSDDVLLFLNVHPQSLAHNSLDGDRLVRAVKAVGVDPSRVVLEITERSEARLDQVIADATRLRSLGFGLALDDVGAGNAGLEMLRDLPVDFVKIDKSVIAGAVDDPQAQAVLIAIIAYARRADAFVIAEGIESEQILSFVRHAHALDVIHDPAIQGGQGYLLGRPSPDLTNAPTNRRPDALAA